MFCAKLVSILALLHIVFSVFCQILSQFLTKCYQNGLEKKMYHRACQLWLLSKPWFSRPKMTHIVATFASTFIFFVHFAFLDNVHPIIVENMIHATPSCLCPLSIPILPALLQIQTNQYHLIQWHVSKLDHPSKYPYHII